MNAVPPPRTLQQLLGDVIRRVNESRAARQRSARNRRCRGRAEDRARVRLAADVAAALEARDDEILRAAVEAEREGLAPPPIPRRSRGGPPSPETVRVRHERRLFMQRAWRARVQQESPSTTRRRRSIPTEADLIRSRRNRRENERRRRASAAGRRWTPAEEASASEAEWSGR